VTLPPDTPDNPRGGNGGDPQHPAWKFTDARKEAVLEAIRLGCTHRLAAQGARITRQGLTNWLDKGRKAQQRQRYLDETTPGERVTPHEQAYLDFLLAFQEAEAFCARLYLKAVLENTRPHQVAGVDRTGAPVVDPETGEPIRQITKLGDGKLALRFMESRFSQDYSDKVHHVVQGGDQPVQTVHTFDFGGLSLEALQRKREEAMEALELRRMQDEGLLLEANGEGRVVVAGDDQGDDDTEPVNE